MFLKLTFSRALIEVEKSSSESLQTVACQFGNSLGSRTKEWGGIILYFKKWKKTALTFKIYIIFQRYGNKPGDPVSVKPELLIKCKLHNILIINYKWDFYEFATIDDVIFNNAGVLVLHRGTSHSKPVTHSSPQPYLIFVNFGAVPHDLGLYKGHQKVRKSKHLKGQLWPRVSKSRFSVIPAPPPPPSQRSVVTPCK